MAVATQVRAAKAVVAAVAPVAGRERADAKPFKEIAQGTPESASPHFESINAAKLDTALMLDSNSRVMRDMSSGVHGDDGGGVSTVRGWHKVAGSSVVTSNASRARKRATAMLGGKPVNPHTPEPRTIRCYGTP